MSNPSPVLIAHLSDVHLSPLAGLAPWHLNVKRALGLGNWMLKRRKVHQRAVVDALVADLARHHPDHIIVSGDLVNLGLPGEHAAALKWLESLGPPSRVTVVPGNHDIYCPLLRDIGVERWRAYMTSDVNGAAYAKPVERGFPFVRFVGDIGLIGLVSAVPTPPFYAHGRLGQAQLRALADILQRLGAAGHTRIVVVHHPPLPGQADQRRGLIDAAELERVLCAHGAELVLHGHNHVDMHAVRQWPGGRIELIGVASASAGRTYKREALGCYNLIGVEGSGATVRLDITSRGLMTPGGNVVETGHRRLGAARAAQALD